MQKTTLDEFLKKATIVHGNKYVYDLVDYKTALIKVKIVCPEHGMFYKTPNKHISRKQGCPVCGRKVNGFNKRTLIEDFIQRANVVHSNKYDYSSVEYITTHTKIKIICRTHGIFLQQPSKHLSGDGCPECGNDSISKKAKSNPTGWSYSSWINASNRSRYFDSFKTYIIKCSGNDEVFYKIGKTFQTINKRFHSKHLMPYSIEIVKIIEDSAENICALEWSLKNKNKENSYIPKIRFSGMYECFTEIKL
jgi:predicted RNA-binding Zn-ribbon protein involved in translation (DUF1610 family)